MLTEKVSAARPGDAHGGQHPHLCAGHAQGGYAGAGKTVFVDGWNAPSLWPTLDANKNEYEIWREAEL